MIRLPHHDGRHSSGACRRVGGCRLHTAGPASSRARAARHADRRSSEDCPRRYRSGAHHRRGIPSVSGNRSTRQGGRLREVHQRGCRRSRPGRTVARRARDSRAAGRDPAGRSGRQARRRRNQSRTGGSRTRAIGARRGASGRRPSGERHEGPAEPRRPAGHRRGGRPRPRGRSAGGHRASRAGWRARAARDCQSRSEQDPDAVRLRAHHGAFCRRHHPPVRRHGRDDPGRHLVSDAGDADRPVVAERSAASGDPRSRVGRLPHPPGHAGGRDHPVVAQDRDRHGRAIRRSAQHRDADDARRGGRAECEAGAGAGHVRRRLARPRSGERRPRRAGSSGGPHRNRIARIRRWTRRHARRAHRDPRPRDRRPRADHDRVERRRSGRRRQPRAAQAGRDRRAEAVAAAAEGVR